MVKNALARRAKGEKGFTLVELLVVVIIIGILAAVSVPVYLNQRKKAWDSNAETDVKNTQLNVETALVDYNGQASKTSWSGLGCGATLADNVTIQCSDGVDITLNTSGDDYTITGSHTSGSKVYTYDSAKGTVTSEDKK